MSEQVVPDQKTRLVIVLTGANKLEGGGRSFVKDRQVRVATNDPVLDYVRRHNHLFKVFSERAKNEAAPPVRKPRSAVRSESQPTPPTPSQEKETTTPLPVEAETEVTPVSVPSEPQPPKRVVYTAEKMYTQEDLEGLERVDLEAICTELEISGVDGRSTKASIIKKLMEEAQDELLEE